MSDEHKNYQDGNAPEGKYANYLEVGYNAFEFIFDFGQLYKAGERPIIHTRIVTSPAYAKAFLETLGNTLGQYERGFGEIREEGLQPND